MSNLPRRVVCPGNSVTVTAGAFPGIDRPSGDFSQMVRLRLQRMGRRHRPFYRINAMDRRSARDSTSIERLGHYDPLEADKSKQVVLKADRIRYWLSVGAQPSETVASLLKNNGIDPTPGKKPD